MDKIFTAFTKHCHSFSALEKHTRQYQYISAAERLSAAAEQKGSASAERHLKQATDPTAFVVNTLTDKAVYRRHETFTSDVRLPAMSLGLRLCASREGGTGGGGWVSALSLGSMAALGWSWVGHFSPPLHKWAEKAVLSPSRASISGSEAFFSV